MIYPREKCFRYERGLEGKIYKKIQVYRGITEFKNVVLNTPSYLRAVDNLQKNRMVIRCKTSLFVSTGADIIFRKYYNKHDLKNWILKDSMLLIDLDLLTSKYLSEEENNSQVDAFINNLITLINNKKP